MTPNRLSRPRLRTANLCAWTACCQPTAAVIENLTPFQRSIPFLVKPRFILCLDFSVEPQSLQYLPRLSEENCSSLGRDCG